MNQPLTIYIADDHKILAQALGGLIQQLPEVEELKIFHDGKQLFDACQENLPDIVCLDIEMPNWDGRKTLVELKALFPELRCLVLSMYNEKELIDDCIKKGAAGYLNKDCTLEELKEAFESSNDIYFSKGVLKHLSGYSQSSQKDELIDPTSLTEREFEVLKLLCEGMTPKEIASKIHLSPRTVETHKTSIMNKFGVNSVGKLISVAYKNKIV